MRCLREEHSTTTHFPRALHLISHIPRAPSFLTHGFEMVDGFGTWFHFMAHGFDYYILILGAPLHLWCLWDDLTTRVGVFTLFKIALHLYGTLS